MSVAPLHRLSPQDAGYLRRETAAQPLHVVPVAMLGPAPDGRPLTVEAVAAHLHDRLPRVALLQRRAKTAPFGIGPPVWVDVDVDVRDHVSPWPDVAPGDDALLAGLAQLTAMPVRRDRPLWDVRVGPLLPDGRTPVAFRFHHALADGGLIRRLFDELLGPDAADGVVADTPSGGRRRPRAPTAGRLLAAGVSARVRDRIGHLRRPATAQSPGVPAAAAQATGVGGVLTGTVSPRRAVGTAMVPLSTLRRLRRQTGATINDLYLTAAADALGAFLRGRDRSAAPEELLALVPRDVRTADDAMEAGNRTLSMLIPLPIGHAAPAERLAAISAVTAAVKAEDRSTGNAGFNYDVAISNVRLGERQALAGRPVHEYVATAPLQGRNRLLLLALSFEDAFTVTTTADADAFPDVADLAAHMDEALARLDRLADGNRP